MRAVLDPNVIVSAALSRDGTPAALLSGWLDGLYDLVISPALLAELGRVRAYPKIGSRVSADEARELLDLLRVRASLVADPDGAPSVRSTDPNDDYLICLAEGSLAVLVTGDTDLQSLADRIPVYTPAAFRALLAQV